MKKALHFLILTLTSSLVLFASNGFCELTPDSEGYIHDWLMLGPIPLETGETGAEAVNFNVIRREATLQPGEGLQMTVSGYGLTWKAVSSESEIFDFNVILNDRVDNAIGYLVAYIDSPEQVDHVILLAGGNDQTRVYFNGKAVTTSTEPRALTKDSDMAKGLTMKQGLNTVILKVVNEVGNWQGCLRFTTQEGKPLTNFQVRMSPNVD